MTTSSRLGLCTKDRRVVIIIIERGQYDRSVYWRELGVIPYHDNGRRTAGRDRWDVANIVRVQTKGRFVTVRRMVYWLINGQPVVERGRRGHCEWRYADRVLVVLICWFGD